VRKASIPSVILLTALLACRDREPAASSRPSSSPVAQASGSPRTAGADPFAAWLVAELPVADGFDFSVGDADGHGGYVDLRTHRAHEGWYVATRFAEHDSLGIHPGEDWNGTGGGNTDLGQDVHAVAAGRVAFSEHCGERWGHVVMIDHLFYENHERRRIRSVYVHLAQPRVHVGDLVTRRQVIAAVGRDPDGLYTAHLHLELRWDATLSPTFWPSSAGHDAPWVREKYAAPSSFIAARRRLPVPQNEPALLLVSTELRRLRVVLAGQHVGDFEVGFGQQTGRKRQKDDLRTPRGMYFVVEKSRGPFPAPYGAYYGGHWIKVNYPNAYDATWGRQQGLLGEDAARGISQAWLRRASTWQGSPLGSGIGFHGWIDDWPLDGPRRLSWGCVVMRNADIAALFDRIPLGAMVVIL
jgi:murein DD-endopeptidase MepM/ murein hydrolase activator NlpD